MATAESQIEAVPRGGAELLRKRKVQLIDLSREIFEGMPMFFAHQKPFMMVNQTHEGWKERFGHDIGFEAHNWLMSEHTGTHTDALLEYIPGGPGLDVTPLEYFYGEAVCLDVSAVRYPDHITPESLEEASARAPEIQSGDIVLLYTGHGERTYPTKDYLEPQTGLNREGALWLADRGVVNIGIDAIAIDHSDDEKFSGHRVCAEYKIVNTEGLANLDRLAGKRFLFLGLPLKFHGGTGSPIRAVAWLYQDE